MLNKTAIALVLTAGMAHAGSFNPALEDPVVVAPRCTTIFYLPCHEGFDKVVTGGGDSINYEVPNDEEDDDEDQGPSDDDENEDDDGDEGGKRGGDNSDANGKGGNKHDRDDHTHAGTETAEDKKD